MIALICSPNMRVGKGTESNSALAQKTSFSFHLTSEQLIQIHIFHSDIGNFATNSSCSTPYIVAVKTEGNL